MTDADAIIIGSGHNALCAGLYLADAGWKVLVLEQGAEPGGGLRSGALTGAGYQHDLYATNVGAFLASPVYRDFGDALARTGLVFLRHDRPFATAFGDGRALPVFCDIDRTVEEIDALAPGDGVRWRSVAALFGRIAPNVMPLMQCPIPSMRAIGIIAGLLKSPADAVQAIRLAAGGCGALTDEWFKSSLVKSLLTPWAFHTDYGPDDRGGAAFAFIAAFAAAQNGLVSPRGGAGELARAILALFAARGGLIHTRSRVARIEFHRGIATGVRTAAGERLEAGRAIIAGVAPIALVNGLLPPDELPKSAKRLRSFAYGPATFVLHLSLRQALQWRSRADLSQFFYVHINGEREQISRTLRQVRQGLLPDRPMIAVSQPTALDPSRAPPGHHVVRLHVRCVPHTILGDAEGTITARDWQAASEPFSRRMLALLVEHAPNVRDVLQDWAWMSPTDIEADNPNMHAGDCSGGSHRLRQHYMFRPAMGWSRHRTPIRNLYLTGAGTWPGAGIHGQSGYLVAQEILARSETRRFAANTA